MSSSGSSFGKHVTRVMRDKGTQLPFVLSRNPVEHRPIERIVAQSVLRNWGESFFTSEIGPEDMDDSFYDCTFAYVHSTSRHYERPLAQELHQATRGRWSRRYKASMMNYTLNGGNAL